MANETEVGSLTINLKIKLEALEKGLETAKKKLQTIEEENKKVESSNKNLEAGHVVLAATAVASLVKIKEALDESVEKYNEYKNANVGLKSVLDGQGKSFTKAQGFIENYISDGLIPLSNATTAYKNLALRGYNDEQIQEVMINLKDAAAFGRQSTLEYGYAIQSATEGLKNMNPVLVDNAGVTKNMSVMYQEYASKIGKSVESLTDEEKILAEVNGIKAETITQTGDAAKYAETYAGQQAAANAQSLQLSQTLGESLIPTYTELTSTQKNILAGLNEMIKSNKPLTAGIVTLVVAILGISGATTAAITGINLYKKAAEAANLTTKAFTASILSNPLFIGATLLALGLSAINMFNTKMQESIDKMNEATEKSNTLSEAIENFGKNGGTYTDTEKTIVENERNEAQQIINIYEEKKNKVQEIQNQINEIKNSDKSNFEKNNEIFALEKESGKALKELSDYEKQINETGTSIENCRNKVNILNKSLEQSDAKTKYLTATNQKAHRETLINIAQTKADIEGKRQLLNILKQGKTTTDDYTDAKNQLVKVYPELAKVNENTIASTEAAIDAESAAADAEWANAQIAIQASILEVQAMMSNSEQIQIIAQATKQSVEDVTASLQSQINILGNLAKLSPADFKGSVTTNFTPKSYRTSSSSASYSNKRLDNYKKEIEHKKALDLLSTQQEISMYEYALRKYTKTADERNEIREKIYELNKELAQKEKEMLDKQTEDYEVYIQNQKNLRGAAYDITEQTSDYNKIIQMHRNYLNQIMKDERLSLDERKSIYREELQTIRDYEQQKRDLRVEQIDNTVSQLTDAITKQLEEMQEKDVEMINKQIEEVEKLKEIRINAINAEYDAKIEAINKELEALDKAEQQKSRDEEDAEYESKKKRLEELVAFEHDAVTKANYQKELNKLIAEYQKTLDNRALEDKKEALNEQKDLIQKEQDDKVQAVEDEVEKQKEAYNKQLEDLEKYYDEQIDMAQETAEKMLINAEQNQDKILNLLKSYGNAYEITGQSLGEKLAQGINESLAGKIENIIQRIQDTIDAGIENKLAQIAGSVYKYEAGANKPQTKTVSVTQINHIEQNPEMPSETYRKLNNVSQKLAEEFAGM